MRTIVTAFLFCFSVLGVQAQNLQQVIDDWVADTDLINAGIGIYVVDAESGLPLANYNEIMALIPASNLKLLTTAPVLEYFGGDKKFETKLYYSGELTGTVLKGNLIIVGSGDPSLGSKIYGGREKLLSTWVAKIKESGIQKIEGRILTDANCFPPYDVPRTWIWEDMGNYYGAGVSGLSFSDNTYYLTFQSGTEPGSATKLITTEPEIPGLNHQNRVVVGEQNRDLAYVFGGPYQYDRYVTGSIPGGRKAFKIKGSVPDPEYFLAHSLGQALLDAGLTDKRTEWVRLDDPFERNKGTLIYTHESPELAKLVTQVNRKSNNSFAEHLFLQLSLDAWGRAKAEASVEMIQQFMEEKKIYSSGVNQVDGSGMSRFNTVTARTLAEVLVYSLNSDFGQYYLNSLSVAGENGTLTTFLKGTELEGKMMGKSGYMERVRSYSGLIKHPEKPLVVSVVVNNYSCSASAMRAKIEKLLISIYGQL